jgi:dTDP-4-amino-4,6-dideoxyglucose
MNYFTTMNLPAPTHEQFNIKLKFYQNKYENAIKDLEIALSDYLEVEKVASFCNCFTAIGLALIHACHDRSKTVAIAGQSYRRTTDIVHWAGLKPIYIDNSIQTLGMSEKKLVKELEKKTIGCILLQHPMVKILNIKIFQKISTEYNVPLIFDSVEAMGSIFDGKKIGGFGLLEAFSLHPSKVLNAAEGGILTFGNEHNFNNFQKRMIKIGVYSEKTGENINFGIEPIHAIMGLASLENNLYNLNIFKKHYLRYKSNLNNSNLVEIIDYDEKINPNYKTILVKMKNKKEKLRMDLLKYLELNNIGARPYYSPLHKNCFNYQLPNAKLLEKKYILLPIGNSVKEDDIDFICEKIEKFN